MGPTPKVLVEQTKRSPEWWRRPTTQPSAPPHFKASTATRQSCRNGPEIADSLARSESDRGLSFSGCRYEWIYNETPSQPCALASPPKLTKRWMAIILCVSIAASPFTSLVRSSLAPALTSPPPAWSSQPPAWSRSSLRTTSPSTQTTTICSLPLSWRTPTLTNMRSALPPPCSPGFMWTKTMGDWGLFLMMLVAQLLTL
ncbi:hypothetical protein BDK51DRAFT_38607 [Blyttiomyces helicus]|uniref:Uncharacterized protein n=1 Tax=Blyttiomyces helicus TaxID=388810 RepID=A0A4P9W8J4_9FUNG|nr:hypothetical protein BDK51DRAFT_38607 [Blyttiomyces helicus]|eukprot:RKO87388.1 hypothetical protein BDK51DRAFT_38607 [Blyttiomyces helicus]